MPTVIYVFFNATTPTEIFALSLHDALPIFADFTGSPTSGTAPLTVQFTDASTGSPTSWAWDFQNDGTVDSTAQNPSFAYAAAGTYTVSLKVTNGSGTSTKTKTGYITVGPAPPVADFTGTPTSGPAPLTVRFSDASTGSPTSWAWDFQNYRPVDSRDRQPSFTYTSASTDAFSHHVTNRAGSTTKTKTGYSNVRSGT